MSKSSGTKSVLLINMPFVSVEYPSIALGLFKSKFRMEGIPCHVENLNALFAEMVGWDNYNSLTHMSGTFAGEQMFARVFFGSSIPDDHTFYIDMLNKAVPGFAERLNNIKSWVIPFISLCMERISWNSYDIIGFTCLFEQNVPSLTLACQIKKQYPEKIIVFGGPNCEDIMGYTLHKNFPFIDYVFTGEADETFPEFVKLLSAGKPILDVPGIIYRENGLSCSTGDPPYIRNMDSLPYPDYDDYFFFLNHSSLSDMFSPFLLFETARGCWWGEKQKCIFCGLNGSNIKFRSKSAGHVIEELSYLVTKYKQIDFLQVVDNVLDNSYFDTLLPEITKLDLNTKFYFEVRPTIGKKQLKTLNEAGCYSFQAGIENLSQRILKLMRKGTTSLHNARLLKWARQFGMTVGWNVIYGFPGEAPEDYARMNELSQILIHLDPPSSVDKFRLDRFSYLFDHADFIGLKNIRPEKIYYYIYPFRDETLFNLSYHFDYDLVSPVDDKGYLERFGKTIMQWKNNQYYCYSVLLTDTTAIYDNRPVATSPMHIIAGVRKWIYEYCDDIRNTEQIKLWLKKKHRRVLDEVSIRKILAEFLSNKLMIQENNKYLSIAVMTYSPQ